MKKFKDLINLSTKMNYNYKKTFAIGFALLLLTIVLAPVLILAQQNETRGFCNRISRISSDTGQRFANRSAKLEQKRERIMERIEERRENRDQRYEEKKAKWDANRADHFAKLDERAVTDEQKEVITDFQQAVVEAMRIRRDAVYAAIQEFRQGIEDAKIARKESIDGTIVAFRDLSEAAIEKAQADCNDGVDPKTVRENLRNELKTAREKYVIARQEIEKIDADMEALITAKREAIEKAQDDFKQALEQAKDDFKAGFPEDEEPEDES